MAFETHGIILFIIAGIELFLGLYVFTRNRRDSVSTTFLLLVISIVIWLLVNAILALSLQSGFNESYYRTAYFSGILIATSFIFFAWVFPYKSSNISKIIKMVLSAIIPIFFILFFFTDLMLVDAVKNGNLSDITYGSLFPLYIVYFSILCAWGFYILFMKLLKAEGMHKWQLKFVIIGTIIPFIVNIITDILMPWMGYPRDAWVVYVGAESSIVLVGLTSYILFKKNI